MAGQNEPDGAPLAQRELTITRIFDAPRELVFALWTEPLHLARWWAPEGFTNPVCEVEPRPGGAFRIVMRGPDGSEYPMRGLFVEFVRPERLVFTSIAFDGNGQPLLDGLTTVTFESLGDKTRLMLHTRVTALVPLAGRMLEGMDIGWTQSIDRLESLVSEEALKRPLAH